MNKSDLIDTVAEKADVSKLVVKQTLDTILETIEVSLVNGNSVSIPGFGIFDVKERAARTGRNPKTGEPLEIPKSWSVAFKVGKSLKDAVISSHREKEV